MTAALLTAAGCGSSTPEAAAPTVASPAPSGLESQLDDPPGTLTCAALSGAIAASSLMNPGVVDTIVRTSGTADAPVADAAQRLATAYNSAISAAGTEKEPDAVAAVGAAASDMSTVCSDSGLKTVG
jgi:hypothetical protein